MARPDLAFSPPSGSSLPAGASAVSWSAPSPASELSVVAGSSPGDHDLLGLTVLAAGAPIALDLPAGERRAWVSAWLSDPDLGTYSYALSYWGADQPPPPETVLRRLVADYWLREWLGESLLDRRLCAARCLGYVGEEDSFSVDAAADVAPWTPAEVRSTVGYVLLRLRELDRLDDGLAAGSRPAGGGAPEVVVSGEYRIYALDFEVAVPSKPAAADSTSLLESRRAEIERLFLGFSAGAAGTALLSVRNLARYPTRRRGGTDDGTFRRAYLTVQVRARVRITHAGPKEVALP